MSPRTPALFRTSALVALGALIVHQLRYVGAYGGDAGGQLAAQGHGYMSQVLPVVIAVALAAIVGCLVRAALRGPAGGGRGQPASAAVFAAAIFATFAAQESIEGALFSGHLDGVAAVVGEGGWLAGPLALALGAMCALADAALGRLEEAIWALCGPRRRRRWAARQALPPRPLFLRRVSPLALGLASRPPPAS
jgi:hypothetical protein